MKSTKSDQCGLESYLKGGYGRHVMLLQIGRELVRNSDHRARHGHSIPSSSSALVSQPQDEEQRRTLAIKPQLHRKCQQMILCGFPTETEAHVVLELVLAYSHGLSTSESILSTAAGAQTCRNLSVTTLPSSASY